MKKVLIISTSPRKNGNSDPLAQAFAGGAKEAGHDVAFVAFREKNIQYCRGCLACQKTFRCVIKDDMAAILENMQKADVVCFATPVYYYACCGQLKTFLDRCNPLSPRNTLSAMSISWPPAPTPIRLPLTARCPM